MKRSILALTSYDVNRFSVEEILEIVKSDLDEANKYGEEYTYSIAFTIVKKLLLMRSSYNKFYQVIFSSLFLNNKYFYESLDNNNLKDLIDVYKDNGSFVDYILADNEVLFNELIFNQGYNIKDVFSDSMIKSFNRKSYKRLLSYLLKGDTKVKVIKSLIKSKNQKFVYMISKMDDIILSRVKDDTEFFDAILTLLNYNNYRCLLWDYYNKYVVTEKNQSVLESDKYAMVVPDELKDLLNYTFNLMYVLYSGDVNLDIIPSMDELIRSFNSGKDMVHTAIFGVLGYKKVKEKTFDVLVDFPIMESENQLINLKIAFFNTIYGLTYDQASKIVNNFDNYMKDFKGRFKEENQLIYETLLAMKSLYDLTLDDKEEIDLYRKVYFKYINKKGIYTTVEVEALIIMESLMHRLYDNSMEIL